MEHSEKINYMRISAGICGYGFKNEQLDLLVNLYELILKKKGKSNIDDVVHIEYEVRQRTEDEKKKALEENLNKEHS